GFRQKVEDVARTVGGRRYREVMAGDSVKDWEAENKYVHSDFNLVHRPDLVSKDGEKTDIVEIKMKKRINEGDRVQARAGKLVSQYNLEEPIDYRIVNLWNEEEEAVNTNIRETLYLLEGVKDLDGKDTGEVDYNHDHCDECSINLDHRLQSYGCRQWVQRKME
ncbi:MAG: hypothetical protein ABEJ72_02950, partial [Candidatus Aenigmatarchaeota archaeon]